ncbi:MAG: hypothetical protein ACLP50_13220 [Solirubrobacteraceae bacterium]
MSSSWTRVAAILLKELRDCELRPAPLEITVDRTTVGSVKKNETFVATIEPGHHTLPVRAGRHWSRIQSFEVAVGDAVNFGGDTRRPWPMYLMSFLVPSLGVWLRRNHHPHR